MSLVTVASFRINGYVANKSSVFHGNSTLDLRVVGNLLCRLCKHLGLPATHKLRIGDGLCFGCEPRSPKVLRILKD